MGRMVNRTMLGYLVIGLALLTFATTVSADEPENQAPFWSELPDGGTATATTISVANQTSTPVRLDVSWGRLAPFSAAALDSTLGTFSVYAPFYCDCLCGGECVECEEPEDAWIDIAAGETTAIDWLGQLARVGMSEWGGCTDVFSPTPGRYLFVVCTAGGAACADAEVTLPAVEPIQLVLTDTAPAPTCAERADIAVRAARTALAHMDLKNIVRTRLSACYPNTVACHDGSEEVELSTEAGRCDLHAWLRSGEVELLVNVPLPEGWVGGAQFRTWLEPFATQIRRVQYTQ